MTTAMDAETKKAVRVRLRRSCGQVQAVDRMVDADRYGLDLMHQLVAIQAAIGKAAEVILASHVRSSLLVAHRRPPRSSCR
jgi:CsoR family transcriptional regulator, copper-sensing transcriptional repressor